MKNLRGIAARWLSPRATAYFGRDHIRQPVTPASMKDCLSAAQGGANRNVAIFALKRLQKVASEQSKRLRGQFGIIRHVCNVMSLGHNSRSVTCCPSITRGRCARELLSSQALGRPRKRGKTTKRISFALRSHPNKPVDRYGYAISSIGKRSSFSISSMNSHIVLSSSQSENSSNPQRMHTSIAIPTRYINSRSG